MLTQCGVHHHDIKGREHSRSICGSAAGKQPVDKSADGGRQCDRGCPRGDRGQGPTVGREGRRGLGVRDY